MSNENESQPRPRNGAEFIYLPEDAVYVVRSANRQGGVMRCGGKERCVRWPLDPRKWQSKTETQPE